MRSYRVGMGLAAGALLLGSPAWSREVDGTLVPSTLFTPPGPFVWVLALGVLLFWAVNRFLISRWWGVPLRAASPAAFVLALFLTYLPMCVITFGGHDQGPGGQVFWGWQWEHARSRFLAGNAQALLLTGCVALCFGFFDPRTGSLRLTRLGRGIAFTAAALCAGAAILPLSPRTGGSDWAWCGPALFGPAGAVLLARQIRWRAIPFLAANLLVPLLCLLPYLAAGAYMHGNPPHFECERNLRDTWSAGLLAYARRHQGHLPNGSTPSQALSQVGALVEREFIVWDPKRPALQCPSGAWLERDPRPYRWNDSLAGRTMDDLRALPPDTEVIGCPYHPRYRITAGMLVEAYDKRYPLVLFGP